jgi:hypothetical protein
MTAITWAHFKTLGSDLIGKQELNFGFIINQVI